MLLSALILCSVLASPIQEKRSDVDPKRVEAAVAELEAAFKPGQPVEARIGAIQKNRTLADPRVAAAIGRGLKDQDSAVQVTAVEASSGKAAPV